MNTRTSVHHWTITAIGGTGQHRSGTAGVYADAWTQALAAGRTALLAGELDTLAVTVDDDQPAAFYNPARDEHGTLDPADVTADLVEMQQRATAGELADQLVAGPVSHTGGNGKSAEEHHGHEHPS